MWTIGELRGKKQNQTGIHMYKETHIHIENHPHRNEYTHTHNVLSHSSDSSYRINKFILIFPKPNFSYESCVSVSFSQISNQYLCNIACPLLSILGGSTCCHCLLLQSAAFRFHPHHLAKTTLRSRFCWGCLNNGFHLDRMCWFWNNCKLSENYENNIKPLLHSIQLRISYQTCSLITFK